jgi:hypothetical protein
VPGKSGREMYLTVLILMFDNNKSVIMIDERVVGGSDIRLPRY